MRLNVCRGIAFALALVPVIAAGAIAQPAPKPFPAPPPAEVEDAAAKRARLQNEMLNALKGIADKGASGPITNPMVPPKKGDYYPPADPNKSIDVVREGMNLFRDGNIEAARRTFFGADPAALAPADRLFAKYMLACSLRKLGKVSEAEVIYREVANTQTTSPDDEFLTGCAIWQLSLIRSATELDAQLEQLRSRAKSK